MESSSSDVSTVQSVSDVWKDSLSGGIRAPVYRYIQAALLWARSRARQDPAWLVYTCSQVQLRAEGSETTYTDRISSEGANQAPEPQRRRTCPCSIVWRHRLLCWTATLPAFRRFRILSVMLGLLEKYLESVLRLARSTSSMPRESIFSRTTKNGANPKSLDASLSALSLSFFLIWENLCSRNGPKRIRRYARNPVAPRVGKNKTAPRIPKGTNARRVPARSTGIVHTRRLW